MNKVKAALWAMLAVIVWLWPDREWWDEWLYSCKVYGIICLTFGVPTIGLYLLMMWVFGA